MTALELHGANSFHSQPSDLDIVNPNHSRQLEPDLKRCDSRDLRQPSIGDRLAEDNDEGVHCEGIIQSAAREF